MAYPNFTPPFSSTLTANSASINTPPFYSSFTPPLYSTFTNIPLQSPNPYASYVSSSNPYTYGSSVNAGSLGSYNSIHPYSQPVGYQNSSSSYASQNSFSNELTPMASQPNRELLVAMQASIREIRDSLLALRDAIREEQRLSDSESLNPVEAPSINDVLVADSVSEIVNERKVMNPPSIPTLEQICKPSHEPSPPHTDITCFPHQPLSLACLVPTSSESAFSGNQRAPFAGSVPDPSFARGESTRTPPPLHGYTSQAVMEEVLTMTEPWGCDLIAEINPKSPPTTPSLPPKPPDPRFPSMPLPPPDRKWCSANVATQFKHHQTIFTPFYSLHAPLPLQQFEPSILPSRFTQSDPTNVKKANLQISASSDLHTLANDESRALPESTIHVLSLRPTAARHVPASDPFDSLIYGCEPLEKNTSCVLVRDAPTNYHHYFTSGKQWDPLIILIV